MTKSLTLVRDTDSIYWRADVLYNATMQVFYLYDKGREHYIVVETNGENSIPTIQVRKRRETEYWIKNEFERGDKFYHGDSSHNGNWIVFKPANIILDDSKTLNAHKTTAHKSVVRKLVRKPATRKVKRV